ncbi:hypothetical protein [Desertivibrio insolitus]|uniref:hypothetical protein n=1 Tax=Herbiconiux sp. SYSU D00978 TaxID=2812562 RepID=UPI001A977F6B|nr:hypothetical protein [Herbiconiux sp. SYSU D00978]
MTKRASTAQTGTVRFTEIEELSRERTLLVMASSALVATVSAVAMMVFATTGVGL